MTHSEYGDSLSFQLLSQLKPSAQELALDDLESMLEDNGIGGPESWAAPGCDVLLAMDGGKIVAAIGVRMVHMLEPLLTSGSGPKEAIAARELVGRAEGMLIQLGARSYLACLSPDHEERLRSRFSMAGAIQPIEGEIYERPL